MEKQDVLLARQPIYTRDREIAAFELLFRDNEKVSSEHFDGNRATSRLLLNVFAESDLKTITGELPAFVNFTEELIHEPPFFDPEFLVVEILEDIDITPKLINSLKSLKSKGYKLALDDFVLSEKYDPILQLVDIIKLELPALTDDALKLTIAQLKKHNVLLLAEKVETPEQFKLCLELGCDYFQGYFLSKPEIIKGSKIAGNKLAVVELISELQAPDIDIQDLTRVIARDPSLSFNLLKLVNSAAYRRSTEIESIHMAVTLLGLDRIKCWASLLALSKINDKPKSLHHLAFIRALMCEKLAEYIMPSAKHRFYTVGLLSCLDAFIDQPLTQIISSISLDQEIKEALLNKSGEAGLALNTAIYFEQGDWSKIDWNQMATYKIDARTVYELYYQCSDETQLTTN